MILTLTPNPSLDRTVSLPGPLQRGAVHIDRSGVKINIHRLPFCCNHSLDNGRTIVEVPPLCDHNVSGLIGAA